MTKESNKITRDPQRCYFVYLHLRADTGVPFYVGFGKKPKTYSTYKSEYKRAFDHSDTRNSFWENVRLKHGITVEIIADELTRSEAVEKEKEFIALYGLYKNGGLLTNLTLGGDGAIGNKANPESIQKSIITRRTTPSKLRKITAEQVAELKTLYNTTSISQKELSKKFNITVAHLTHIVKGETWDWVEPKIIPRNHVLGHKLTSDDVIQIKQLLENGERVQVVADKFKVAATTIYNIINNKNKLWGDLTDSVSFQKTSGNPKLTADKVAEMRKLRNEGATIHDLVDRYGLKKSSIYGILSGYTWQNVGGNG